MISPTDYKANAITGKQRVFGGRFGNQLGQTPWISMDEEVITFDAITGTIYQNQCGSVTCSFSDPDKVLPLRNPADDTKIGESTHAQVMLLLYSLGRQMQLERDLVRTQAVYDADPSAENLVKLTAVLEAL